MSNLRCEKCGSPVGLATEVIKWFQDHPEESLLTSDVAIKWRRSVHNVNTALRDAVNDGRLKSQKSAGSKMREYSLP